MLNLSKSTNVHRVVALPYPSQVSGSLSSPGPGLRYASDRDSFTTLCSHTYSRGQPKPSNLLSRQGVHLGPRFLQILTQIVEMNQKTHLRKLSHDVLGLPIFWEKKSQHF